MAAVLVGLAVGCAWGQRPGVKVPVVPDATTVVMPAGPLLPRTNLLVPSSPEYPVPDETAETQALLREDGLIRSESRVTLVFTASKPVTSGWIKAYQFGDATGAYSAYTYFRMGGRPSQSEKVNATDVATQGGERVYLDGTSVVRAKVNQYPDSLNGLLKNISLGLPKVSGRKALPPLLPTMLPAEAGGVRLDPQSVRYALGTAGYAVMGGVLPGETLSWDKSLEVATASYAGKGGTGTLTLLLYPTPQIAGIQGRGIEKAINDKGAASFGTVKMRRVGQLLGVTSGGLTAEQAEALVAALHLNEVATFDKPMPLEFHAEVRKTATLLQQIAIFTGVLILASVVIAVFLGGARAGIRVLRGKSAASEPEFLTINLRDKPKALFVPVRRGDRDAKL